MCGISGIFNFDHTPVQAFELQRMMNLMKHRGPDDEGTYIDNNVGLGFVRLSILDLSPSGHQPMFSNNKRYVILFNGEIFNYIELKEELKNKYEFKSNCDTEVILAAYQEWGESCLDKLNGMWAFAIYDNQDKKIFLARDRYGVKPLYYYKDKNTFVFFSEINSFYKFIPNGATPNDKIIFEYLTFNRTDQSTQTFINEINKLQHGHFLLISKEGIKEKKWYDLRQKINKPWESSEAFRKTFSSAVGIRLRSDVPVGVCLSGGLDSSSVTKTIIDDFSRNDLYTFSAVYGENERGDESKFINLFAKHLKNLVYVYPTDKTLIEEDFEDFINCHLEPVPSLSIYSQYKVLKEAKKKVTVALDGQGADEQIAGYLNFYGSYFKELICKLSFAKAANEMMLYYANNKKTEAFKFLALYLSPPFLKKMMINQSVSWINKSFYEINLKKSQLIEQLYSPKGLIDSLLQHFEYKLEHNLKWNDLNSMFFSLELRVPFMDYRVVEGNLSLKANQIINNGYTKSILRRAMAEVLPPEILWRKDKVGFENPSDKWFKNTFFIEKIKQILNSTTFKNSGYFNSKECNKIFQDHLDNRANHFKTIWKWIHLYYFLSRINKS